jgi:hypothetical protein
MAYHLIFYEFLILTAPFKESHYPPSKGYLCIFVHNMREEAKQT